MEMAIYRCLYDFIGEDKETDLSLQRGDVILILRKINNDWFEGRTIDGQGLFPAGYVEKLFDTVPNSIGIATTTFSGEQPGDLALEDGDVVGITLNVDENWSKGFTVHSNGIFPTKFVKKLDFSSNNSDVAYAIVLEEFHSQNDDEISLKAGDKVEMIKEIDSFWILGHCNNARGKFPKTFVKIIKDLPENLKFKEPEKKPKNKSSSESLESLEPKAKALFMFVGTSKDELSFDKGDIILLKERFNNEWLKGSIGNSVGLFPANHVEIIVDLAYCENKNEHSVTVKDKKNVPKRPGNSPGLYAKQNDEANAPDLPPKKKSITGAKTLPTPKPRNPQPRTLKFPDSDASEKLKTNGETVNNNNSESLKTNTEIAQPSKAGEGKPKAPAPPTVIPPVPVKRQMNNKSMNNKSTPSINQTPSSKLARSFSFGKNRNPKVSEKPRPLSKRKSNPTTPEDYQFKLTEEKIFDMHSYEPNTLSKDLLCPPLNPSKPLIKPPLKTTNPLLKTIQNSSDQQNPTKSVVKPRKSVPLEPIKGPALLSTPLAPTPVARPTTLNFTQRASSLKAKRKAPATPQSSSSLDSPLILINNTSVSFKKESATMPRSETDPNILKSAAASDLSRISSTLKSFKNSTSSLTAKSLSNPGSLDGLNDNENEVKDFDKQITHIKTKIEAEVHQLAGVDTLLDFVGEEKQSDLMTKKDLHNRNIVELNEQLNALEDEKSYLLASLGKVEDVKNRVTELERQISTYLSNCEQLRRMQDVSAAEELPEIRDNIDFCENMIDTLQDELNGLQAKLDDFDAPDSAAPSEKSLEKQRRNQERVIEELVTTEQNYFNDIRRLCMEIKPLLEQHKDDLINTEVLFGNLEDIVKVSKKLLSHLKDAVSDSTKCVPKEIARCFCELSAEMKESYATYCRNYDDVQSLLETYEEDQEIQSRFCKACTDVGIENGAFALPAFLIKPVQRVLKYPLLLRELLKNSAKEKDELRVSLDTMTDVAAAINEFKRRKDLVVKYREEEEGIGKKVQKLNWHSVAKKSSRINQRITQFTGFNSQTVDEKFIEQEKHFRSIEKMMKTVLKNVTMYLEAFRENSASEYAYTESLRQFYEGEVTPEEMVKFYGRIFMITETYSKQMCDFIVQHVQEPLSQLLQLFQAPFRLIQKRHNKCLDYDRAINRATRARDSKEKEKINQTQEELTTCKNIYTALNIQLLEELPVLTEKCSHFLHYCLSAFVDANRRYLASAYEQIMQVWKLAFVRKEVDKFDRHQEMIEKACDQLLKLTFAPHSKDGSRKSGTPMQSASNTSFFVDVESPNIEEAKLPVEDLLTADSLFNLSPSNDPTCPILTPNCVAVDRIDSNNKEHGSFNNAFKDDSSLFVVKFDFEADSSVEITAMEGAVLQLLRDHDNHGNREWWLMADPTNGQSGYIPHDYLEKYCEPGHLTVGSSHFYLGENNNVVGSQLQTVLEKSHFYVENIASEPNTSAHDKHLEGDKQSKATNNETATRSSDDKLYLVEFNFSPVNVGELSAQEGDVVRVLQKHDLHGNTEWWLVQHRDDAAKCGFIPKAYVSEINPG